ncbi:hypothetical protein C7212DRAFT_331246, partial [Tuber magnatum]
MKNRPPAIPETSRKGWAQWWPQHGSSLEYSIRLRTGRVRWALSMCWELLFPRSSY